jgi:molybdate transport system substrate-binding protein
MKSLKVLCLTFFLSVCIAGGEVLSGELVVAAGAGYKRPLARIYKAFEKKTGIQLSPVFGNMRQILSQVEKSARVGVAIGDQSFLEKSQLFEPFKPLGQGRLVIIYNKYPISTYDELVRKKIVYIAAPDPNKAIYGRAAFQFFERSGLEASLAGKMIVTATVPQVSGFVISGSVEAGFVNVTDAIAMKDSIGGWLEIPQDFYDPIRIGMAVTKGWADKAEVVAFGKFMEGSFAKKIFVEYGL